MSEQQPITCDRCGAPVPRSIDGLCPSCLAQRMASLLDQPEAVGDLAPEIEGIEIHEPVGAGGMGLVFRGERESDGEALAVKVLPRNLSADPERCERFQREAAALFALDHPNIVTLLGSGETLDGRLFLAMELVEGCDLRRLLRTGKLEPARAIDIAGKVAAALGHAHSRGIVHRDVKPGNILIGDGGVVKVADFGIARAIAGSVSTFTLTQTREAFGTPYYIAPELATDATVAAPTSDVYALGVLFYEMLTGHVPMGNFTPASQEANVDRKVDALIASALADVPAARIASMEEFQHALIELRLRMQRQVVGRRWVRIAGIAAALVLAAGAGVAVTYHQLTQEPPAFPNPASATRDQPWENSLGMKFVPVPETAVLFSIWETRRQDYQAAMLESGLEEAGEGELGQSYLKMGTIRDGKEVFEDLTWQEPGFPQTDTHPVIGVSLLSANQFCRWLTTREHTLGRLPKGSRYRMPSPDEWDAAWRVGTPEDGNVPGLEVLADGWPDTIPHLETTDAFPRTAPVGSFPANAAGLFDLYGNVMEGCVDRTAPGPAAERRNFAINVSARGASWREIGTRLDFAPRRGQQQRPYFRRSDLGFRIVLDLGQQ
ncbi:MAG: protein kinase [Verrucomicrobiales bacterium]